MRGQCHAAERVTEKLAQATRQATGVEWKSRAPSLSKCRGNTHCPVAAPSRRQRLCGLVNKISGKKEMFSAFFNTQKRDTFVIGNNFHVSDTNNN